MDGCRAGWVGVLGRVVGRAVVVDEVRIFGAFREAAALGCDAVAVDIPIGLPSSAVPGGRGADRGARALLGKRASSVFSTPIRGVLGCDTYREALSVMRASSEHAIGLTIQTWNIVPKIREVDEVVRAESGGIIEECHPELSFFGMAGRPMSHRKATPEGAEERIAVLEQSGIAVATASLAGAKIDDVLDAHACLWTAARIALGEASCVPDPNEPAEVDACGLRMRIRY